MRWLTALIPILIFGCSSSSEPTADAGADPCAQVVCDVVGTICAPEDGLCHCGTGPVCDPAQTCDSAQGLCDTPLAAVCTSGSAFVPGMQAFRDVTEAWGLTDLAVHGTRVAVADIDADGWPDVFVRAGGNGTDDWAGVRRSWLLRNTGTGFEDVTQSSGVRQTRVDDSGVGRPGEVVAFADVDNDGDLDIYTGMSTQVEGALPNETSEIMLNDGAGGFDLGPQANPLRREGSPDIVAGASFVDYDRDGRIDLWIGQHNYAPLGSNSTVFKQDYLYQGQGDGTFVDVTSQVGLTTEDWRDLGDLDEGRAHSRAWSSAACDLNGDGTPELMAASYGRAPNHLWQGLWVGDGTVAFQNKSVESGYAYDGNPNWQDNEFARCYCQQTPAADGCAGAPAPRVQCPATPNWNHSNDRHAFRLGGNSGTTVCADVNNDGHLDLLTTEITHWWAGSGADRSELLLNQGTQDVRFERPGEAATGLSRPHPTASWDQGDMTAAVFDFDNDGWPDIYVGASDYPGNHGLLYRQVMPGMFEAVTVQDGVDHNRSHGVVAADFDRDGDLDLLVGHSRSRCDASAANNCYETRQVRLFENVLGDQGNWLQVDLKGAEGTNKMAIGARVTVTAGGVTQTQEIGGGHGHYGIQKDHVLHFGLGGACDAQVTVRWPDSDLTTQTFSLVSGHRFEWVQGEEPQPVARTGS